MGEEFERLLLEVIAKTAGTTQLNASDHDLLHFWLDQAITKHNQNCQ